MATYERQPTSPIVDGDSLDASEVDAELEAIRAVINGGLDNANLDGSAGITGANMAATTITGAKVASNTITKAKLVVAATGQVTLNDEAGSAGTLSDVATWQDCLDTSDITIENLVSGEDWIILDYSGRYVNSDADSVVMNFGFSIDGADPSAPVSLYILPTTETETMVCHWAYQATSTSHTIRPQVKMTVARTPVQQATSDVRVIFRAFSIPAK